MQAVPRRVDPTCGFVSATDTVGTFGAMELPYDAVELLQTNGIRFIDIVSSTDRTTSVPSCAGWTIADLAHHQGEVWHFWARVLADGITDRTRLKEIVAPVRLDDDLLVDWLATTHNELYSALVSATPDQPAWTWTGSNQDARWVRRRMAQESSVHLWDAANTAGHPYAIPTAVAADGIDEFLEFYLGRERVDGAMKVGGTVHLHCTDTSESDVAGGEWFISSVKEPTSTFTREHRKGDAAVRGTAHQLLLWLWRRDEFDDGTVEVIGNEVVARRLRAYTALD